MDRRTGILRAATFSVTVVSAVWASGCEGAKGEPGALGPSGPAGPAGPAGPMGAMGAPGTPGGPATAPDAAATSPDGGVDAPGVDAAVLGPPANAPFGPSPLSGVVAVRIADPLFPSIKDLVVAKVNLLAAGAVPEDVGFPLAIAATDTLRLAPGLKANVLAKWLDPLGFDNTARGAYFGANADFVSFIGDKWETTGTPHWSGSGSKGWLWVNHEYLSGEAGTSNLEPSETSAPAGQPLTLARFMRGLGVLTNDVLAPSWSPSNLDTFINWHKKMVGGSWMRVVQDPASGEWLLDRGAKNLRYDATSASLFKMSGYPLKAFESTDEGRGLVAGIVPGTAGNCSGGTTPWGTIISAEENTQGYYGDPEPCWDSNQKFLKDLGCNAGAAISIDTKPTKPASLGFYTSTANGRHARDTLGWLVEIDPGIAPDVVEGQNGNAGVGHKKLGALGRARWENISFVLGTDWKPLEGKPLVAYYGDDRRGGRVWKFVSKNNYQASLTRAAKRALLDEGTIYAAHFAGLDNAKGDKLVGNVEPTEAAPGNGRWIKFSVSSTDIAPNAAALNAATKTVGEALKDNNWNGIGGFPDDNEVRRALFTAANKVGVMELNRPEDVEWNPKDPSGTPRLYIAFTNHNRRTALDQDGKLRDPDTHGMSAARADRLGSMFALEETNAADPSASTTFKYFAVWRGTESGSDIYAAANIDQIVIDRDGAVWFGTDGNYGTQRGSSVAGARAHSDAYYYLDLDVAHKASAVPTFGKAFRFIAVPSDAEATGPAFTPDMKTMFVSVQHPGEEQASTWPAP